MKNGKIMENTLMCPVCGKALLPTEDGKSAACTGARRHLFDFASDGYINLHTSHAAGGDSDECIRARNAFLSKGYYSKIADQINALIDEYVGASPAKILDAGCGEGYYTNKMAENTDRLVYGFDLSKAGVKTGAKAVARKGFDERTFYGVASVFSLPVQPESMDAVTTIFSPCAEKEYARVLKDCGVLFLVGAGKEHLMGLKRAIYDSAYENEGRRDLPTSLFSLAEERTLSYDITLESREDIQNLFAMTPYFYRTSLNDKEKLLSLSSLSTKIDVELFVYKKIKNP